MSAALVVDSYGQPVTFPRFRWPGCLCRVPCLAFVCTSKHHKGDRRAPWCNGCSDDEPGSCDTCWCVSHKRAS